ncbi:protein GDAP2 homolog isoform X2 [Ctenocephalides felis]|uniref:protein GDAP2 homolog isoform X2 n=1 Tax=Ctenocephalides felis TaxID=7515 RepID=UPI000E6E40CA|nr:protein GDAP2 homolog isoform X2 [Ctenocephalides felis]
MRLVNGTMEPLGVAGSEIQVVPLTSLRRWSDVSSHPARQNADYSASGEKPKHKLSPFPRDRRLNEKIAMWIGDISTLQVDAIVNPTNESMNERNPTSDSIYARAGPMLKEELHMDVKECRTGEAKLTQGHNLPARYIIHTVGPKFNVKYQTAAENTLHSCYRSVLHKSRELGLHSIALPVINSVQKNYPPDQGAHVALRTIRRFLETYGSTMHTIVLALQNSDAGIYEVLLPLYFPRTEAEEESARWQLPENVGGLLGEPLQPDRQIRIIDNPRHAYHSDDDSVSLSLSEDFTRMHGDLDRERLLGERPQCDPIIDTMAKELRHQERYERLLRRAKTEDLTEVSGIGCLYQSGVDRLGRPVVVFCGKWFPVNNLNLDKALLYLIALLDPIVKGDYVIAYFHTLTSNNNYPSFAWLREVYSILPYKYKKNLKAFYIIHPTIWTKMMTWWFTTFMAPAIKQKVHSLPGVEHLYSVMTPDQLEIPAYITEYDMTINGLHYFQPGQTTAAT